MTKYIVEHDRPECISCGACTAIDEEVWELDEEDGLANCLKSEIDEEELERNISAAESCPVDIIHIKNKETNEKII